MRRWLYFPSGANAPYTAQGVLFDGTNDYMARGANLTGSADGKVGTTSFWIRYNGSSDGARQIILFGSVASGGSWRFERNTSNKYEIRIHDVPVSAFAIDKASTSDWNEADGWHHVLCSWDMAVGFQLYVNDASDAAAGGTFTNTDLNQVGSDWWIGTDNTTTPRGDFDIADLWHARTRIDLSVEANRRKFRSAAGKPVNLGSDGSTPTGSAPLIYQSGSVAAWHTNKGSGGGFTLTGTLTASADSPSD
jgi:hypothetical protein